MFLPSKKNFDSGRQLRNAVCCQSICRTITLYSLRSAVEKFKYLKEGIAIVLIFIGVKMLISYFGIHLHIAVSLLVIILCLGGAGVWASEKKKQVLKKTSSPD